MADETTSRAIEPSSSPRPVTAAERRASSHAGTTDTDQLVSDIEKTREELAVTIDAIVDRVSPKKVVERGKQQAREGLNDASVIVREHASTAAEVVKEKALIAGEAAKKAAAQVKERVSGSSDSSTVRSPLTPATSVAIGSASPVAAAASPADSQAGSPSEPSGPSPLPAGTVSVDAGALPPLEPVDDTGSLADAADRTGPLLEPAGADLPAGRTAAHAAPASVPPVYLGAGLAAVVALLALVSRRRRARRRLRTGRRY